ncbi:phosphotransferase [Oceanobacillus zhaokaii]|uniref:phosphotransferase n=1 Tax=Oceanobacillus zhaokaii TaxID=2052660 RepID=UPI0026C040FA
MTSYGGVGRTGSKLTSYGQNVQLSFMETASRSYFNSQEQRVTGFIDWTEARVDDPAHDFVSHLMAFGEKSLRELIGCL